MEINHEKFGHIVIQPEALIYRPEFIIGRTDTTYHV